MSEHVSLAAALVAAQAELPAVEKDARNPHFNSMFVSLDHLIAKTRPVLNKHGLAVTQAPAHIDGAPALETTLIHVSGETRTSVMPLLVDRANMQGLGSAISYAKRYAWAAALGISADEDDDGNLATEVADKAASSPVGDGSAVNPAAGASPTSPAPAAPNGEFRFETGKHAGKTLSEAPKGYVEWAATDHPKPEVRAAAEAWLHPEVMDIATEGDIDDIPF